MKFNLRLLTVMCCLLISLAALVAQDKPLPSFEKKQEMIVMRDGVKLFTVIHAPKEQKEALPIIMVRSPYGVGGQTPNSSYLRDLADEGYIFVFQDIRGRYKSEGQFVMSRPPRDPKDDRRPSTRAPTPTTPSTGC